jgi:hypothetical protein
MLRVWYVPAEVTSDVMNEDSRRAFLSRLLAGAGAVVAFGPLPDFSLAHDHAAAQVNAGESKFAFFTPEEARQMEAVCEQIIPSDDGPGAREAGAIYFIDYALSQTEPDLQPIFRAGLKDLAAACAPDKFSELSATQQIAALKKLERTEFREVPHEDGRRQSHSAIDDPVARHESRFRPSPEHDDQGDCDTWKEGIDQSRYPQLASPNGQLHLSAVRPARDIDPIVNHN